MSNDSLSRRDHWATVAFDRILQQILEQNAPWSADLIQRAAVRAYEWADGMEKARGPEPVPPIRYPTPFHLREGY